MMMMAEAKGSVRRSAVRGGDDDRRLLHWMEFGAKNGGGNAMMPSSDVEISAAASRAVLTHATFSIDGCIVVVSASDHPSSPPERHRRYHRRSSAAVDRRRRRGAAGSGGRDRHVESEHES